MTYHLYIANKNYSSWSLRPWLLMRTLNIPFEEHLVPFQSSNDGRQPQFSTFSPTCQVPCLHHFPSSPSPTTAPTPQDNPIIVWESLAIIDYLADLHPSLPIWPSLSTPKGLERRAWARSAAAEMHAGFAALRNEMGTNVGLRIEFSSSASSPAVERDLGRLDELWTDGLRRFGGPYLAGPEFGAVDAFFAPVVLRLQTFVGSGRYLLSEESKVYAMTVLELPELRAWVEAALGEPWRVGRLEEGAVRGRRVLEDLRG
ncbi:hypothetical protein CONLIGDRAFT_697727 [Coniochaeta ligniaria NRRL 30616]|uniref:GST N-terminal domain-containing protein n=1 Tax=Coniochaeta ligniaria NRRL 30616 TaxID=1408157 RepID=A0A1J7JDY5_9PEZI|nr:hypothetical protein CONLIGDRAFT_697727 [Coniochaeta ligniaria NRRL 30616]